MWKKYNTQNKTNIKFTQKKKNICNMLKEYDIVLLAYEKEEKKSR